MIFLVKATYVISSYDMPSSCAICHPAHPSQEMSTLNQQKCQEISVFPRDHLILLLLQTGKIHALQQKSRKGAA